jgi:hypothetical protein
VNGSGFQESGHYDERYRRKVRDEYLDDPLLTLLVDLSSFVAVLGGTLGVIFALGYSGQGFAHWGPDVLIVVCLVSANVALRLQRHRRAVANRRRYHPDDHRPRR